MTPMLARSAWSATVGQATFEPELDELDEPDELDDEPDDEPEPEPDEDEPAPVALPAFLSPDDPESLEPDPLDPLDSDFDSDSDFDFDSDSDPLAPLAAARLASAPFWLLRLSVR